MPRNKSHTSQSTAHQRRNSLTHPQTKTATTKTIPNNAATNSTTMTTMTTTSRSSRCSSPFYWLGSSITTTRIFLILLAIFWTFLLVWINDNHSGSNTNDIDSYHHLLDSSLSSLSSMSSSQQKQTNSSQRGSKEQQQAELSPVPLQQQIASFFAANATTAATKKLTANTMKLTVTSVEAPIIRHQREHQQQQSQHSTPYDRTAQSVPRSSIRRTYHTTVTADRVTILYSTIAHDGKSNNNNNESSSSSSLSSSLSSSSSSSSLLSSLAACSRSHAIVYLVQKTHSTYQRDSFGLLLQSLDLLFQHYFAITPNTTSSHHDDDDDDQNTMMRRDDKLNNTDIYLFHTGDFTQRDLQFLEDRYAAAYYHNHIINNYNNITSPSHGPLHYHHRHHHRPLASMFRLADLSQSKYWQLPKLLRRDNISSWFRYPQFSIGYRHMCSWFAFGIWEFFDRLNQPLLPSQQQQSPQPSFNYTYLWRLDEDSFLLSPVSYDIFQYMHQHDFVYGYRLCSYELDYNYYIKSWFDRWHARTKPRRTIVLENAGMCAFYNNFFVARISWFRQGIVQDFLKLMRPRIYRMRYGDLLLHTMALYAFAKEGESDNHNRIIDNTTATSNNSNNITHSSVIHRFLDFTYQHITYNTTSQCVLYGGIQAGYDDPNANATMHQFYQHQQAIQQQQQGHCLEPLQRFWLSASDLSPTYQHLPSTLGSMRNHNLALETIVVGRMEIPGKGILSG